MLQICEVRVEDTTPALLNKIEALVNSYPVTSVPILEDSKIDEYQNIEVPGYDNHNPNTITKELSKRWTIFNTHAIQTDQNTEADGKVITRHLLTDELGNRIILLICSNNDMVRVKTRVFFGYMASPSVQCELVSRLGLTTDNWRFVNHEIYPME